MNVIGYVRVSTEEQGRSGLGLEAQAAAIRAACEQRSWELVAIEQDIASGGSRKKRPGLDSALAACRSRQVSGIVVAKLDRLSRSVVDAGGLLEEARKRGFNIVALDFGLDLSMPQGELVANVLASVAQWERRIIAARIRDAFAVKREHGDPRQVSPKARRLIIELHDAGLSQRAIAAELNRRRAKAIGKCWHKETVTRILRAERRPATT